MEGPRARDAPPELQRRRSLEGNGGVYSRFVDRDGTEYDPDGLAWRYLGAYMDCDAVVASGQKRRYGSNGEGGGDGDCRRHLLWAAYRDPGYEGHSLQEYALYNFDSGGYDGSTCLASGDAYANIEEGGPRCVNLDCHEANTGFELVGVFKETGGLYEFTRELMQHEGYCVGGGGGGNATEVWMDDWPTSCTSIPNPNFYGSDLYLDFAPLPEGKIALAIYEDARCTMPSTEYDLTSYLELHYYAYYRDEERGAEVAAMYEEAVERWNERMEAFKVCQPCRAYDLSSEGAQEGNNAEEGGEEGGQEKDGEPDEDIEEEGEEEQDEERDEERDDADEDEEGEPDEEGDEEGDEGERWLSEYYDAGQGEWRGRYDCVDYEGYVNANQCYLFGESTTMEVATKRDLARASAQGSILEVKAYWRTYGGTSHLSIGRLAAYVSLGILAAAGLAWLMRFAWRRKRRNMPESLKEALTEVDDGTAAHSHSAGSHTTGHSDDDSALSADEEIEAGIEIAILSTSRKQCTPIKKPNRALSAQGGDRALEEEVARRRALLEALGRATEVTRVQDEDGERSDAEAARRRALLETLGRATEMSRVRADSPA